MPTTTGEGAGSTSASTGWDEEYDLVVLGAGAAGMTAALVSAIEGMRTLFIDKSYLVGGTTAFSSGSVWIPNNPEPRGNGITGVAVTARLYL
ncbi:MAG: FAD-binding protein, partial [Candidatus Methylomirabilales bacterium]